MTPLDALPSGMIARLRSAAEMVDRHDSFLLISHYDADGITSAQIVRETLARKGKRSEVVIFPTLSDEQMNRVMTMSAECVIMTDLGTSYLKELESRNWDIAILDHHRIAEGAEIPSRDGFVFVNPMEFGIDGSANACAAAVSFLFSLTVDPANKDLAPLAMAGMYGDSQNYGGFESVDLDIVESAMADGSVKRFTNMAYPSGLTFYQAMMSCPDPYQVGTTGRADKVTRFIKSCELAMTDTPNNVSQERIDDFAEALASRMRRTGVTEEIIADTFGDRYYSERYQMDVSVLASILDGCGRTGKYDKAFEACDSMDFTEATLESQEYDEALIDSIATLSEKVVRMENIQYFVTDKLGFAGNTARAIVRYLGDPEKPVVGVTLTEGRTDLSSRGTDHQLSKGLNLSDAMRNVCGQIGGQGGGHAIAAGGTIPAGKEKEFLAALDRYIGRQFGKN